MSKFLEEGSVALEIKEKKKLTIKIFFTFFLWAGGPKKIFHFFSFGPGAQTPLGPSLIIAKLPLAN